MEIYLGILDDISELKCRLFFFLKDRFEYRINRWLVRWLIKGGNEFFIRLRFN